ncbi:tRNA (adenosine(37)-N6)-threonylcarbamoyltransferase complex ATPase subunit type 1 TsaE [Pseudohoeflea coraliihabitans]|uniref:tRNA (Adenosine(37)-N6)-threonylcarbamoyltransferase complex ATPase subunit type 1 TsaE n=1 Tax=Pseudohoeflea coraliihabitans TaxID=2860393 RepID=A0ABS6WVI8_9HYPH|nr:tRNA (adenosine(37)-N6)-threonylcarbamoyltransferase complex ATPase subunit type 1 TsaE [Pseudohoeflea sp. DP4N28-3]
MTTGDIHIHLADLAATERLGEDIALAMARGDCLALHGDLGAGKSTLARAILRALADDPHLDVPSPTFTLVQTYDDLRVPVSHFDLYRLNGSDELDELGFEESLDNGAVLVEWPQRAADRMPIDAVTLVLSGTGESRDITISAPADFAARLARSRAARIFLDNSGYPGAERRFLQGDASARSYERVGSDNPLILMNAPRRPDGPPLRDGLPYSSLAHLAEDVRPFVAIGSWLRDHGFAAPEIPAADLDAGFLLVEDLGNATLLEADGTPDPERYAHAIDVLAALHELPAPGRIALSQGPPHAVPAYDPRAMQIEVELLVDWYLPARGKGADDDALRAEYLSAWQGLFAELAAAPKALVLRDYHSPNLIWRPQAQGLQKIGIIDFQDAVIGPAAYDVASLVQDARVTVPPALCENLLRRYEAARLRSNRNFDAERFRRDYAIMAAQRAAKILGIFVRLDRRDGKPHYLRHLPRIETYLAALLAAPVLAPLRFWCDRAGILTGER